MNENTHSSPKRDEQLAREREKENQEREIQLALDQERQNQDRDEQLTRENETQEREIQLTSEQERQNQNREIESAREREIEMSLERQREIQEREAATAQEREREDMLASKQDRQEHGALLPPEIPDQIEGVVERNLRQNCAPEDRDQKNGQIEEENNRDSDEQEEELPWKHLPSIPNLIPPELQNFKPLEKVKFRGREFVSTIRIVILFLCAVAMTSS